MRQPPQVTARRAAALGNRHKQLPGKPLREGTALTRAEKKQETWPTERGEKSQISDGVSGGKANCEIKLCEGGERGSLAQRFAWQLFLAVP